MKKGIDLIIDVNQIKIKLESDQKILTDERQGIN
jgi:hypothetical protein